MNPSTFRDVLGVPPAEVLDWIGAADAASQDFNWLGLAELAYANAKLARPEEAPEVQWIEVPVRCYAILSTRHRQDSELFRYSEMYTRLKAIERLGPDSDRDVLNPDRIIAWAQDLPLSIDEAEELARAWQTLPIDTIRELRRVKNRLIIMKRLHRLGLVKARHPCVQRLDLIDRLP